MAKGDFYILCPDNDVDETRDSRRVEWSMRDIIEARRKSGLPVLLTEDGRVAGVVGDRELYSGILGTSSKVPS